MSRLLRRLSCGSLLLVTACRGADAREPPPPPPPTTTTTSTTSSAAADVAPSSSPPTPALPRDVRKVETLARCDTQLAIFPVGRSWFGMCGGASDQGSAFVIDEAGGLHEEPRALAGLPPDATLRVAGGPSIDALEVAIDLPGLRGEIRHFMRRRGKRWVDIPSGQVPETYFQQTRFQSSWVLALDGYEIGAEPLEGALRATDRGRRPTWTPTPATGTGGRCPRRIPRYVGMTRDTEGAVWGVGTTCDGALAAERFEIGKPGSTLETILPPGTFGQGAWIEDGGMLASPHGVIAYANHDREKTASGAYAVTRQPIVVRREAGRWRRLGTGAVGPTTISRAVVAGAGHVLMVGGEELHHVGSDAVTPVLKGVESVVVAPDGTAWAHGKRDVYRWVDGRVERVILDGDAPRDREVVDIRFDAKGRVMIVAGGADRDDSVLLRETTENATAATKPLLLHGYRGFTSPLSSFSQIDRAPPYGNCGRILVLLYRLAKTAPADYDFPATRAALRGRVRFSDVEFVELEVGGERHFVAVIMYDADLAFALARKIEAGVRGSKPLVFCESRHGPPLPITRSIEIDLATGEIKKPAANP